MKLDIGCPHLWAFDFDGTISPIVSDRNQARLHPVCLELLADLSARPGHRVAVLSSRSIEDLVSRVPLRDLVLGGASGLELRLPGGHRVHPGTRTESRRDKARVIAGPLIARLSSFPGVEVEDKGWSIAVHYRHVLPESLAMLEPLMKELGRTPDIRVYRGPCAAEVQLLPNVSKSFGVRRICRILAIDPSKGRLFYAGDDESDGIAMRWVLRKGGAAYAVGSHLRIAGARHAEDPIALVKAVRSLAFASPHGAENDREAGA
jgi:trehalose 6-phosphate phosphatase